MGKNHEKYPLAKENDAPFIPSLDKTGRVMIRFDLSKRNRTSLFTKFGKFNETLPPNIKEWLGPTAEEIIREKEENNSKDRARIEVLREEAKITDISEGVRGTIEAEAEREENFGEREQENERIQERMSLRDLIKAILKQYGFTITAVITAVGVVIGAIVSNLKAGLAKVAKGVGNGLKDIGNNLAQILPGMFGAIASFMFKTAGEIVGFLAKNARLLIVAVVVYFVEELKNKKKR